jgi:hypothetical protein
MRSTFFSSTLPLLMLLGGCSSQGLVAVSGTVLMDDKPLSGARVVFYPIETPANANATMGEAYGKTDDAGRYSLRQTLSDSAGAGPGRYRVSISAHTAPIPDPLSDALPPSGDTEPIPARYNAQSELVFDVPAGGTTQADFRLTSGPASRQSK